MIVCACLYKRRTSENKWSTSTKECSVHNAIYLPAFLCAVVPLSAVGLAQTWPGCGPGPSNPQMCVMQHHIVLLCIITCVFVCVCVCVCVCAPRCREHTNMAGVVTYSDLDNCDGNYNKWSLFFKVQAFIIPINLSQYQFDNIRGDGVWRRWAQT